MFNGKTSNYLLVFIIILGLSSCNKYSRLQREMEGYWGFDLCLINGEDYAFTGFSSNAIVFNENNNCRLPQFYLNGDFKGQQYAKWRLVDSIGQVFIIIEDAENILSNTYVIEFMYNEQKNLHKVYLENNNIRIKMTKALSNWN